MNTYLVKRLAILAAAAVVASTAACSTDGAATVASETPTVSASPDPVADTSTDTDSVFLSLLASKGLPSTSKSIDAAKSTCDALDAGNSMSSLTNMAAGEFGNYLGGYFVGASVSAYCPWHTSLITGGVR